MNAQAQCVRRSQNVYFRLGQSGAVILNHPIATTLIHTLPTVSSSSTSSPPPPPPLPPCRHLLGCWWLTCSSARPTPFTPFASLAHLANPLPGIHFPNSHILISRKFISFELSPLFKGRKYEYKSIYYFLREDAAPPPFNPGEDARVNRRPTFFSFFSLHPFIKRSTIFLARLR